MPPTTALALTTPGVSEASASAPTRPGPEPAPPFVRLTLADWIRLGALLFAHLVAFGSGLWSIHREIEHRLTAVETTQAQLVEIMRELRHTRGDR